MAELYKVSGALPFGIYFNKPDGSLAQTVIQQVKIPGLQVGEKLIINAQTTVSCLRLDPVAYPGFDYPAFTASCLYISPYSQGTWLDGSASAIGPQSGQDIHNGKTSPPMDPYCDHDQATMYEIAPGQEGDQWIVFSAWCSSYNATGNSIEKNEYLLVIPQQTQLHVMRLT